MNPSKDAKPKHVAPGLELRLEAAHAAGCDVECLDPATGYLFSLSRSDRTQVLLGGLSPLNDAVASAVASDKFHCATLLDAAGFRVPRHARCLRPGRFADADFKGHRGFSTLPAFVDTVGMPVIVKPGHGARGRGVAAVQTIEALESAISDIWRDDHLAVVEEAVPGIDLRIDMLDEQCLIAYLRHPLEIVGDGVRSLTELVAETFANGDADDTANHRDIAASLSAAGYVPKRVLATAEHLVFEALVLNLNRLATADVIVPLPEEWRDLASRIRHALGLRHLGIDLKIRSLEAGPGAATIIEVNASPSMEQIALRGHYERALAGEIAVVEAILNRPLS